MDVADVNEVIKNVCDMYGATLIKSSKAISAVNRRQYWKDRTHLSDIGTRDLLYSYEQYVPVLKGGNVNPGSCSFCGESGHNSRKCRSGGNISCYGCNRVGHKAKHCRFDY